MRWRPQLSSLFGAALLTCGLANGAAAETATSSRLTIGYVDITGDPRHLPIRASERIVLKQRDHPFAGAQVGIEDAKALERVLKTEFVLERISVPSSDKVTDAVLQASEGGRIRHFVIDAPADAFKPLAAAVRGRDVLLFNATASEDWLRRDLCSPEIVHTLPSDAMAMDALLQYLLSRKWRDILVLQGPLPADATRTKAIERSAKKFSARLVAVQQFKPGTDPRERESNNPLLLTGINRDYDVVFVADDAFDFSRTLPYRTARPRPVVGAVGLEPVAWHWTWDNHGALQLNSRFQKIADGRHMAGEDWAAWAAVKLVVQAALRTRSADFRQQRDFILSGAGIDGYKGLAVSVRPWDRQLRQAVLLATPEAVTVTAPVEGFLHRTNVLDTLGDDEQESPCRQR